MNTKRILNITPVLFATLIALAVALPAAAESAAELLEKGIYTEETVGDLKAAIEFYTRVVEDDSANRPHVAQAQFRLGMCYLKRGSATEAREALDKLIREFPEQERLVAQAREQLAAAQPALVLGAVPWEDGESLRYNMSLPTGKRMGSLYLKAESTVVDGAEAWRLELRRFLVNNADAYGVSRILVDRDTQRPISSTFRHGVLGQAAAIYGPDGVEIKSGATETHVESDQEVYDNDQSMHLMRTLPLKLGYKAKIRLLPTWTGTVLDLGLEVTGKDICHVAAGDFECYEVALDNGETYWFSTGREQYVVRLKGGGIVVELAEIGQTTPGAPRPFGLDDFGFSGTLPAGWLTHEYRFPDRESSAMIRLLDPEAATISAVEVDRCRRAKCPPLQETSERELAGAKRRFEAFELREGSWIDRSIDGRPAISFIGDYQRAGKSWVQYRVYTFTDEVRLEFIFRTPADHFKELRATFDAIAENVRAE